METNNSGQGRSPQDDQNVSGRSNEQWNAGEQENQLDREAGDGGLGSDNVQASGGQTGQGQGQSGYGNEGQGGTGESNIDDDMGESSNTDGMNAGGQDRYDSAAQETQGGAGHGGQPQDLGEPYQETDDSVNATGRDFGGSDDQSKTAANGGSVGGKVSSDPGSQQDG